MVAYASRTLKKHEHNYPTHDLEMAAVTPVEKYELEAKKMARTPERL